MATKSRWFLLSASTLLIACSSGDQGQSPLELRARPLAAIYQNPDSLPVTWSLRNVGRTPRLVRDYAAFYNFTLLDSSGRIVAPEVDDRHHVSSTEDAIELPPGRALVHTINLACVPAPLGTAPIMPDTTGHRCVLRYRLREAGDYRLAIRLVPLPPPDASDARLAEFLPSTADTVALRVVL